MAATKTYKTRGIVLRKTKLAEKDLIVTMLSESGALVRCVAKGARKPGGSLAGRIELFSAVDCLVARGRNLDVLAEARIAKDRPIREYGLEQAACASPLAELLANVAQEELEHPRLYEMTLKAFDAIAGADPAHSLALSAAGLLKVLASAGFRPSLDTCVSCGGRVDIENGVAWTNVTFEDGGVLCAECARPADCVPVETPAILWARVLMYSRFADIAAMDADMATMFSVLQFTRQWARVHTGRDLKSIDFIFTSGLF